MNRDLSLQNSPIVVNGAIAMVGHSFLKASKHGDNHLNSDPWKQPNADSTHFLAARFDDPRPF
jgi:hypothetical protein